MATDQQNKKITFVNEYEGSVGLVKASSLQGVGNYNNKIIFNIKLCF